MKARLIPVYFMPGKNEDFDRQLVVLKELLAEVADVLEPVALGSQLPDADAVVFPQLLGEAFKQIAEIKKIALPLLVVTSEFGTVAMWDWEIVSFLKAEGLKTFAPYNLELTKAICKSLAVKRDLRETTFLVFQDNPGEGFQADIFKPESTIWRSSRPMGWLPGSVAGSATYATLIRSGSTRAKWSKCSNRRNLGVPPKQ
jgi:hypothetical protein